MAIQVRTWSRTPGNQYENNFQDDEYSRAYGYFRYIRGKYLKVEIWLIKDESDSVMLAEDPVKTSTKN
jgi:hypothetical protein